MSTYKRLYLGTNTKMYKTISETVSYLKELHALTCDLKDFPLDLFVIPSYTTLDQAGQLLSDSHIRLGAQNMSWENEGQYTGEISPLMLKETGVSIIEIGHSERRHILGETDEQEEKKVALAAAHGLTPLLCIGETGRQREYGISDETLATQLKIGLHSIQAKQACNLWIAYEPVWAIGVNGIPATGDYVMARHKTIRETLVGLFGAEIGADIPVLYGGSVNPDNAVELIQLPEVDGLFIGRSAWNAGQFNHIIRQILLDWTK
ncbi:MAG: triose-phosphate isomerase [Lachnospiraceae bacterium]